MRTATKRAGGTVHNHGGSPGKRLGLKKFSGPCVRPLLAVSPSDAVPDQAVIPGNIIVRQRGTQFHPGPHVSIYNATACFNSLTMSTSTQVKMGRDHTIYATAPGFVRFYKEKWLSGHRKFVGVVLERGEKLPRDETSFGRSRHFGLVNLNKPAELSRS